MKLITVTNAKFNEPWWTT